MAVRIRRRLPRQVPLDELLSAGRLGLLEAARRYKPDSGVPFAAYARRRVEGAILDDLRGRDMLGRAARQEVREGRRTHLVVQWSALAPHRDRPAPRPAEDFLLARGPGPDQAAANALCRQAIDGALERLPPRQAAVIRGRYLEGATRAAVAAELRLSETRVDQLQRAALGQLAQLLAPWRSVR